MPGILQQVMHELRIKQYRSSAYHAESQGALRKISPDLGKYDKVILFRRKKNIGMKVYTFYILAVRESVQESLGFSPFELVFGPTVHEPL